jgi:hypothetical protein
VPPFTTGRTPEIPVNNDIAGISAATSERNVGCAGDPVVGPANTVFSGSVASVIAMVPEDVIGLPVSLRNPGTVTATDETVPPAPPMLISTILPFESIVYRWLLVSVKRVKEPTGGGFGAAPLSPIIIGIRYPYITRFPVDDI